LPAAPEPGGRDSVPRQTRPRPNGGTKAWTKWEDCLPPQTEPGARRGSRRRKSTGAVIAETATKT